MEYILMIILISHGNGGIHSSNVPVATQSVFTSKAACENAKNLIIKDWREAGLISETNAVSPAWKKSDEQISTERNYSATCLPKSL